MFCLMTVYYFKGVKVIKIINKLTFFFTPVPFATFPTTTNLIQTKIVQNVYKKFHNL